MKIVQILVDGDSLLGLADNGNVYIQKADEYQQQEYDGSIPRQVTRYKNYRWCLLIANRDY